MPWPHLPPDFCDKHPSAWVTLSNREYDPQPGQELYNRYLDELEYAEQVGFDGICVNEHHQTAYGLMPAPNILAAALARRTSRAKIAILGNAIPLRDHPLRVAEEVAILDVLTGGRIISGFVRGIGAEYYSFDLDPTVSRERFVEAHDLIVRAWTEPGPFQHQGKHYRVRYVNPWPRPLQKPHPPIWLPSTGSVETLEMAARYGYPFVRVYERAATVKALFDEVRAVYRAFGKECPPENLGWSMPVYVSDTDGNAEREASEHVLYLFRQLSHRPFQFIVPPGYSSAASLSRALQRAATRRSSAAMSYQDLLETGFITFGSPDTVRRRLLDYQRDMGFGKLVPLMHFGSLPHDLTVRSMRLFAEEVMPALREAPLAATAS
ncbi:MAG TPA: LLM class flavin-dependent oxidoreductase [Chloroflexota bacterium]|nr:LLM class flavin-dependent oxidoreductase [Chloroflexota bacterium]